ncbi:hypothetical protein [Pedobacter xixiisoli]|uniref:Uncharacterized protein n=1 Tax=Pedobacter xixiisoli TaxID=1476464 RepID=A0A285ZR48_9SPHI|nr:hypothetical protein [Pedobacter xixiisoli]SOD12124.1 hypothetical protein SAMN06297358_0506 [Pedobacter xixiisoli]
MDVTYYIQNGMLEAYALGTLDSKNAAEIEELLQSNIELGEALEEILIKIDGNQNQTLHSTG